MIKVYQTKFGGFNASDEEKGNCFQAALASILELPLEVCPHSWDYPGDTWYEETNKWLKQYGLVMTGYDVTDNNHLLLPPLGYHLIDVKSTTLHNGELHVVVGHNGEVVHDPNPNAQSVGEKKTFWLFAELNPARTMKQGISYKEG